MLTFVRLVIQCDCLIDELTPYLGKEPIYRVNAA